MCVYSMEKCLGDMDEYFLISFQNAIKKLFFCMFVQKQQFEK